MVVSTLTVVNPKVIEKLKKAGAERFISAVFTNHHEAETTYTALCDVADPNDLLLQKVEVIEGEGMGDYIKAMVGATVRIVFE